MKSASLEVLEVSISEYKKHLGENEQDSKQNLIQIEVTGQSVRVEVVREPADSHNKPHDPEEEELFEQFLRFQNLQQSFRTDSLVLNWLIWHSSDPCHSHFTSDH